MGSFEWKPVLQEEKCIFSTIKDERRIEALITASVSEEYLKDRDIVRRGDVGDSLFVIGSGSAEALLEVTEGETIPLSTMGKGDVFGEMAVFGRKRERAATVRAKENCTILKIERSVIQDLLKEYPDIGSRLLLLMGDRLRHNNEQILAAHLKTVEEKLKLFDIRLDNQERSVEASLKAAQTVFDQTKQRADEIIKRADAIINSAERSRDRLTKYAGFVLTFVTIVGTLLGWFGLKQENKTAKAVSETENSAREVERYRREIARSAQELEKQTQDVVKVTNETKDLNRTVNELMPSVGKLKEVLIAIYRPRLLDALATASDSDALEAYQQLQVAGGIGAKVSPEDDELPTFLRNFEREVVAKAEPPSPKSNQESRNQESRVNNFVHLLQSAVTDAPNAREKLDAYYLLFVYAYLTNQTDLQRTARVELEEYVKSTPFQGYLKSERARKEKWRAATRELADRIKREPGKRGQDLRNLSDRAYVKLN